MTSFRVYEVFRQKAPGEPHGHVGEVEAPDEEAAMMLAKEHFARREVCSSLWVVDREAVRRSEWTPETMAAGRLKSYRRSGGIRASAPAGAS